MTCVQAAAEMGVSASQVRRWVQSGAPVVRERRPMLVDVIDLQRWRRQRASEVLDAVALAMLSAVRCELIDGKSAARLIGIDDRRAAALFLAAFARVRDEMAGPEVPDEPVHKAIDQLKRIAGMPV